MPKNQHKKNLKKQKNTGINIQAGVCHKRFSLLIYERTLFAMNL